MSKIKAGDILSRNNKLKDTDHSNKISKNEESDFQPFGDKCVVMMSSGVFSVYSLLWASRKYKYLESLTLEFKESHGIECQSAEFLSSFFDAYHNMMFLKNTEFEYLLGSYPTSDLSKIFMIFSSVYNSVMLRDVRDIVSGISDSELIDRLLPLLEYTLSKDKKQFKIHFPCYGMSYEDVLARIYDTSNKAEELLSFSSSCESDHEYFCGKCSKCKRRKEAFYTIGVEDPLITRLKK